MSTTDSFDDKKIKHLEFIQSVITRMNSNSFVIKGWVITIVSAVLALLASTHNKSFIVISALPIIVFWIVDSFYLQIERKFVRLYEETIAHGSTIPSFSLNLKIKEIEDDKRNRYLNCFFSKTIVSFYLALLLISGGCVFFISSANDAKKPLKVDLSSAAPPGNNHAANLAATNYRHHKEMNRCKAKNLMPPFPSRDPIVSLQEQLHEI